MRIPTRLIGRDQPGEHICQLCFGSPIARRQISHPEYTDTICEFLPGQVFGVIWWRRELDDRQHRTVAVLEAIPSAHLGFTLPDLSTSVLVHAILDQHGPAGTGGGVDRFLLLIEHIRQEGRDPAHVPSLIYRILSHHILFDQKYSLTSVLQCLRYSHVSNN